MKKTSILVAILLIVCGISSYASAAPYTGADITLDGSNFSDLSDSNRWFADGDAIWTAWANEWVEYTVDLTAGNWNIGVNAINHGNLGTDWYTVFNISNNLTSETITVPASDDEEFSGYINYNILNDDTYTIKYTWLNDKYDSPLDANIQINSVFFDDTDTAPVPEPSTIILFGIGLIGLFFGKRKKFQK